MIKETPVIDHLAVQVQNRQSNEWENLHHWLTRCSIRRGGGRRAPVNTMQVGTANLDLVGDIDVQYDARLAPNRPVRVVRTDVIPGRHMYSGPEGLPLLNVDAPPEIEGVAGLSLVTDWGTGPDGQQVLTVALHSDGTGTAAPVEITNSISVSFWASGMTPGRTYKLTGTAADGSPETKAGQVYLMGFTYGKDDSSDGSGYTYGARREYDGTAYTPIPEVTFTMPAIDPYGGAWQFIQIQPEQGQIVIDPATAGTYMYTGIGSFNMEELPTEPTPIFTGKIGDTTQQHVLDKTTGDLTTFTTMVAHDAVQDHANTQRYGAVTEGSAGRETWADRINRLARSSTVPVNLRTPSDIIVDYWDGDTLDYWYPKASLLPLPSNPTYVTVGGDPRAIQWLLAADQGYDASYRGYVGAPVISVTPGRVYRVAMSVQVIKTDGVTGADEFRFGVNLDTLLPDQNTPYEASKLVTFHDDEPQRITLDWTATGTSAWIDLHATVSEGKTADDWVMVPEGESVQIRVWDYSVSIVNYDEPYLLQDVEYESSLVNHFDLACNSVGARWWVDTAGVTQFQRLFEGQQFDAVLTDRPAELVEDATAPIHYTDLSTGFDTGAVVNQLRINQHGREITPNGPQAVNETYLATDSNSMLSWGRRAGNIDTCLYLGETHSADLDLLSRRVFQDHARARYQINRVRWNAQENPALAASLDVYARVQGFFRDLTQRARIVGIRHEITPTRWMVDYDLTDIQVGPTFAEFNTAYSGWTFADLNAEFAGATFAEFNADPIHEYTEWTTQRTNYALSPFGQADLPPYGTPADSTRTGGVTTPGPVHPIEGIPATAEHLVISSGAHGVGIVLTGPLDPGEYVISCWVLRRAGADTAMGFAHYQYASIGTARTFPYNSWVYLQETYMVGETSTGSPIGWRQAGTVDETVDTQFYVTNMQVARVGEAAPHDALVVSGDRDDADKGERYVWAGDPNASPSYYQTRERIE